MIADVLRVVALSTLASSAAIVLILLLRKPVRNRFGAQLAYALWALVPLVAVIALLPAPTVSVAPMSFFAAAPVAAQALTPTVAAAPSIDPMPWLGAVWLFGIAACATLFLRQQRRFVRALGSLSSGDNRTFRAQTTAGCPALIGAWRPRIVLPADFEQRYDRIERKLILAHERAHMARCDAQLNALAAALRCLNWFNPLFHFAASRFRFDQELACDAGVISRFPEARRPYADAMLKTQLADLGLPAGCHWQSSHPLKERVAMLKQPLPGRLRRWLGGACVAAIVAAASFAAWAAQPVAAPVGQPAQPPIDVACCGHENASYRKLNRIVYPAPALAMKIEGVVYIKVHLGAIGNLVTAEVDTTRSAVNASLRDAALSGVRTWTFNPATKEGRPLESDEIIPIVFSLKADAIPKVSGGTLEAIRISPPQADLESSVKMPLSEDVEFSRMHPPKYPAAALKKREQGEVTLKVHVDEQGNPVEAVVLKTDPPDMAPEFGSASIATAMQWKFNPVRKDGTSVAGWVQVPVTFSLTKK